MKLLIVLLGLLAAPENAVWLDTSSHLLWTTTDNRVGLSWRQAIRYCAALRAEGYADWRLPSIDELQGIYQPNSSTFHLRAPLRLSGWQWSATPGQQAGESWVFDFSDGGRASVAHGDSGLNRALCVRDASDGHAETNAHQIGQ